VITFNFPRWNQLSVAEFLELEWVTTRTSRLFELHLYPIAPYDRAISRCESGTYELLWTVSNCGQQLAMS
jgi:hypothetical protein